MLLLILALLVLDAEGGPENTGWRYATNSKGESCTDFCANKAGIGLSCAMGRTQLVISRAAWTTVTTALANSAVPSRQCSSYSVISDGGCFPPGRTDGCTGNGEGHAWPSWVASTGVCEYQDSSTQLGRPSTCGAAYSSNERLCCCVRADQNSATGIQSACPLSADDCVGGTVWSHCGSNANAPKACCVAPSPTTAPTTGTPTTSLPTASPTTSAPTSEPSAAPTDAPTVSPTTAPTTAPTAAPSAAPTTEPSAAPTNAPTVSPTTAPTSSPTAAPSVAPTISPTAEPTGSPVTTNRPTAAPSANPTGAPTTSPTTPTTVAPSTAPTTAPTGAPSVAAVPVAAPAAAPPVAAPAAAPVATPTSVAARPEDEEDLDIDSGVASVTFSSGARLSACWCTLLLVAGWITGEW